MSVVYKTYFDRYKELQADYSICRNIDGLLPFEDKQRMTFDERKATRERLMENYDVVVDYIGSGYAHQKYRVLKNAPGLSTLDLAVICDSGNLCFGYRTEGSIICVYID